MLAERSAAEAAREIGSAMAAADIPYAIGGALALAVAGVPRGTADVDLNIFLDEPNRVFPILRRLGIEFDDTIATAAALGDGMFVARWDGMRIDVFLPSIPFSKESETTRVQLTDASGWTGWFLSAESIAVYKLLFFRSKDIADLERLVAVRPSLNRDYIRRWIVDMMGVDDERTKRWDRIVAEHA